MNVVVLTVTLIQTHKQIFNVKELSSSKIYITVTDNHLSLISDLKQMSVILILSQDIMIMSS